MRYSYIIVFLIITIFSHAQNTNQSAFKQLKQELPTPNMYRTGGGAPGAFYYQQQANYDIDLTLDNEKQRISADETITYINHAPESLEYLWIQLDQNMRSPNSATRKIQKPQIDERTTYRDIEDLFYDFKGGFNIEHVKTAGDKAYNYTVNNTMLRVNLRNPLQSGDSIKINIKWWYNINNRHEIGGRSGYEYFSDEDNYIYTIAQFFPRMAVYNDVEGWQNKQFLGRGEFALPFGDYDVKITTPADHVVGATGKLQNADKVLSKTQRERLKSAGRDTSNPTMIINEKEARKNEKGKPSKATKTWHFRAENVRDFAFASSRKFIWDAMAVPMGDRTVLAMSYYPKEGNPLWERYSTRVVAHTLKVYSKYTFDYPYHKAISVHTDRIGMEYPMICFNGGRPEADGTYSERTKYGMIGVIIHEVGHNFFPMIVNSDERQWTWMDEGLNTFIQYLTEQEWEENYPSRRGPAYKIVDYMRSQADEQMPIMTNSESILQFGNNAYGKPATALNILRETVMGRELFDYAFKRYCQRWKFKHPTPADFFRTMEDASAVDLDWFFRGWFYTTNPVDIAIESVEPYQISTGDPDVEMPIAEAKDRREEKFIGNRRNDTALEGKRYADAFPSMLDFYNRYDEYDVLDYDRERYRQYKESLTPESRALLKTKWNYYQIHFRNKGGLVMPVILKFTFEDGTHEIVRQPAQIWLKNEKAFKKVYKFEKKVESIELDPFLETADIDRDNNYWPPRDEPSRFKLFYRKHNKKPNRMQQADQ